MQWGELKTRGPYLALVLHAAFLGDFGPGEVVAQHAFEPRVAGGEAGDLGELLGSGDASEEDALALASGDCFFAITSGLVAGPKADRVFIVAEVDNVMPAFLTSDFISPPDFEKIAGPGFLPTGEVDAATEVGDELGTAGSVGIPTPKDAVAVFLIGSDDELLRDFGRELLGGLE